MRVLFMGTPDFALPCLQELYEAGHEITGILTQPDRPAGRGQRMMPSPVKRRAMKMGFPLLQPERLRDPALLLTLKELHPDLAVVVAYGKILPNEVLHTPLLGCINVHASLLPRYRGAAPIQHALMKGETETGITIMEMDEGMDTGPILLQVPHPIFPWDNAGTLHDRLALIAPQALSQALDLLHRGRLQPRSQREEEATYAPPLRAEEGLIKWDKPAPDLHCLTRALSPQPSAHTFWKGMRLKVLKTRTGEDSPCPFPPGTILGFPAHAIRVATGSGSLLLEEIQPEGRRAMQGDEFARGQRLVLGDSFGESPPGGKADET